MKEFIKENMAIVAAIVLPLILIVIFALSTAVKTVSVPDPVHDFLIATNYNETYTKFTFAVTDDKVGVTFRPEEKAKNGDYYINTQTPRLFRVRVKTATVEEIPLTIPADQKGGTVKIPALDNLKIQNIQPAPDGYYYVDSYTYNDRGVMGELFSVGRGRDNVSLALEKDGRRYTIKAGGDSEWRYNSRFIGWVVSE